MKNPHQYPRKILLAIIGMTPQIVTETLYKLAVDSKPTFVPTEIQIITTVEGARSTKIALLGAEKGTGEFYNFCQDYGFSGIAFDEKSLHVISDPEGSFIDDNQSTLHNKVASDFITARVREMTGDENSAVHLSLAGGRKTMSFYAGYALSLYGRMQDRLSHVLVPEQFQSNPNFFYPRPQPKRLEVNNTYYSTAEAKIILADIPFVRMRYHVPEKLLSGDAGYQETVDIIQRFANNETVEINVARKQLKLNDIEIPMADADLAFYLWFCKRRIDRKSPLNPDENVYVNDFLDVYAEIVGSTLGGMYARVEESIKCEPEDQKRWFQQRISKVKKAIENILEKRFAQPFLIQNVRTKQEGAYEITLPSRAITIQ